MGYEQAACVTWVSTHTTIPEPSAVERVPGYGAFRLFFLEGMSYPFCIYSNPPSPASDSVGAYIGRSMPMLPSKFKSPIALP